MGPRADAGRVGRWLFFSFLLLFILTMHGRVFSDSRYHFEQIETFIETGLFVMWPASEPEPPPQRLVGWVGEGVDGHWYFLLPPGIALTATPLGLLGAGLGVPTPGPDGPGIPDRALIFWASLLMPLAIASMLWSIFRLAYESSGSIKRGLQAALVIGLATNTWFYATTFWTRPLAAACLIGALAMLLRAENRAGPWSVAGGLLGWALVVRPDMVFVIPWFVGVAAYRARQHVRAAGYTMIPILITVLALMLWNEHRYGDLLDTGSPHQTAHHYRLQYLRQALPRLLFGANDGLFRYVPALLLGVVAIPAVWKRHRDVLILCLGAAATLILFYASYLWSRSPTPIAWGSRHLYPVVPLLLIPAFVSRDYDPLARRWAKLLVALSIPLQFHGVWQRSRLAPPFWWLSDNAYWLPALALGAILVACIWRLIGALDLHGTMDAETMP